MNKAKTIIKRKLDNFKDRERVKLVKQWFADSGDKTKRIDYNNLKENSIVFDVGGYEGQWASDIFSKFLPKIFIFEPVPKYADDISKRFVNNKKIVIYKFGLSNKNIKSLINMSDDGSSVFGKDGEKIKIKLIKASDFIKENDIKKIDLLKINIEGGEYDLLEDLIENNLIKEITNIQIQFHNFIPNAEKRMINIQKELSKTHKLTYQYKFVWENWALK